MADIELIVKIPEEKIAIEYGKVISIGRNNDKELADYIFAGTPLPKGHGRLIDVSEYENDYFNVSITYDDGNHIHEIYTREIPTIIEADKGDKEWQEKKQ
jgi:hypothetical protein